jgi:hypothetical protein
VFVHQVADDPEDNGNNEHPDHEFLASIAPGSSTVAGSR